MRGEVWLWKGRATKGVERGLRRAVEAEAGEDGVAEAA